ncbi:MAG: T9SS type A sorting domain-containing protein [Bacteroidota bacterium]
MLKINPSSQIFLSRKALSIVGVLTVLTVVAAFYSNQSTTISDLHWEPVCYSCDNNFGKYQLDWSNPSYWSAGALNRKLKDIDGSGTEFHFSYSGAHNKLAAMGPGATPNIQTFFTGGSKDALSHFVNPGLSASESISITVQIKPAIPAEIAFDVYHINGNWYSGDKLKIYAEDEADGSLIFPTFSSTANPSWEERGDGTIDAVVPGTSYADVAAGVNFSSSRMIDKIVFEWSNCNLCGTGVHGFGIGDITFFSNSNSLPVEWGALDIDWQDSDALITWETEAEMNTKEFVIERSIDGEYYDSLNKLAAAGNSTETKQYAFIDRDARFKGQNTLYYRIKQIDMDGAFSYSKLLKLAPNTDISLELVVFPNPASDVISFKLAGALENDFVYQVLNSSGQLITRGQMGLLADMQLEVSDWPAGVYHLKLSNNSQQISKSFQVNH